jgi:uncharacterized membrane protein YesL
VVWAGVKAFWRGIVHFNQRGYAYIWANVIWVVLSLPIVTAPAAWAGLVRMTHNAQRHPSTDLRDVWDGFKVHFRQGIVMGMLNLLIVGINVWNLLAYSQAEGVTAIALRVVWVAILFVWFTVQLYMWPLFYEMEQPTLFGAMRNAAVMLVLNPLFTLGLWLGIVVLVVLSTFFPVAWFLLTVGMLAAIANTAVLDRLRAGGYKNLPDTAIRL